MISTSASTRPTRFSTFGIVEYKRATSYQHPAQHHPLIATAIHEEYRSLYIGAVIV